MVRVFSELLKTYVRYEEPLFLINSKVEGSSESNNLSTVTKLANREDKFLYFSIISYVFDNSTSLLRYYIINQTGKLKPLVKAKQNKYDLQITNGENTWFYPLEFSRAAYDKKYKYICSFNYTKFNIPILDNFRNILQTYKNASIKIEYYSVEEQKKLLEERGYKIVECVLYGPEHLENLFCYYKVV
jgi:hypothetical protein